MAWLSGHNAPAFRLTVDGVDISSRIEKRLISLSMTDNRGLEADELTIELSDHDGRLPFPPLGGEARLELGWAGEALIDKGSFIIDEVGWQAAPGRLSITARSVNLCEKMNVKKERSWHGATIGAIVKTIAEEAKIEAVIADGLASVEIRHRDQTNESDASFLTRLARDFDAIAAAKAGRLLFFRKGRGQTASGRPLPAMTIRMIDGDQPKIAIANRNRYNRVEAFWIDRASGQKKNVVFRKKDGAEDGVERVEKRKKTKADAQASPAGNTYTLRHAFASEEEAREAALSTWKRLQRGRIGFQMTLAMGRADLFPERPVSVEGVRAEIDGLDWIITKASHSLSDGGFTTALELELLSDLEAEEGGAAEGGADEEEDGAEIGEEGL